MFIVFGLSTGISVFYDVFVFKIRRIDIIDIISNGDVSITIIYDYNEILLG